MAKNCSECGIEGGFLEVRKRSLPMSASRLLCKNCYKGIEEKERAELRQINDWKEAILRRFYEGTIKQFCREMSIPVSEKRWTTAVSRKGTRYKRYYTYYFTFDELVEDLTKSAHLDDIIDFAKRKKIPVRDIVVEIDQCNAEKEFVKMTSQGEIDDGKYRNLIDDITQFKPLLNNYQNELPYQIDLARFLMQSFPSTKVELQRGSARPDIIVDNIAVEIKGPTNQRELRTIADKCLRYPQYFEHGLIIVLFDVKVTSRYYDDWKKGLINKFPNISIIRK